MGDLKLTLEKKREILRQEYVLVQYDLTFRNLPRSIDLSENVFAFTDKNIRLGLDPVPVNKEPATCRYLAGIGEGRRHAVDLDVGYEVPDAGKGLFGPVDSCKYLVHSAF